MPLRALLFDLDGTLADTTAANFSAYEQALAEVGVAVDRTHFGHVANGRNWRQFLPELVAHAGVNADPLAIARRKTELYADKVAGMSLNQPLLTLAETARSTMATALVTTASSASVRAIVAHHRLDAFFTLIITGDDVPRHKPYPDAYVLAASRLGVRPSDCLAFEDSDIGVASARAAGVGVVRVVF